LAKDCAMLVTKPVIDHVDALKSVNVKFALVVTLPVYTTTIFDKHQRMIKQILPVSRLMITSKATIKS